MEKGIIFPGTVAPDSEKFNISGPIHLTTIDWSNFDHRRSIAASLVQGVYILERDHQQNGERPQAQAPPWWSFFNFQLICPPLIDPEDNSIFGAIYELKSFTYNAPRYVIAFRGTLFTPNTMCRDLKEDLRIFLDSLHNSPRFKVAMHAVRDKVLTAGATNVWLTGHSLGSAIALLAGKNMARNGDPIETYLFNQPFLSATYERIKNEYAKKLIRCTASVVKAGLAIAINGSSPNGQFDRLSYWIPYLFVSQADCLCSNYIPYFEHRIKMDELGAGKIERIATQNTTRGLLLSAIRKDDLEPLHLIPSAYMTVNLADSPDWKRAHEIQQWWDRSCDVQSTLHKLNE